MRNLFLLLLLHLAANLVAQDTPVETTISPFFKVDERQIVETKWRYTYATHVESNTIIHQAEEDYEYFLHFKYDYTYEQYFNGQLTKGNWSLVNNELFYRFKHINKFIIATINKEKLVLEFTQPNSKGNYQYHFIKVSSQEAPFIKPANELPDVNVDAINLRKSKKPWWAFGRKKKKKKKAPIAPQEQETYISIELIGGGYYGGIDPVLRDYIQIKNTGRLIKEFKSVQNGLVVTKKDISRQELEAFAQYIVDQDFFNFERVYDCETALCQKRKQLKPTPIPLRLMVAYGTRKKVVSVSIWGDDNQNMQYVNYPPALDNIIDAIQRMAHRIDDSYSAKK